MWPDPSCRQAWSLTVSAGTNQALHKLHELVTFGRLPARRVHFTLYQEEPRLPYSSFLFFVGHGAYSILIDFGNSPTFLRRFEHGYEAIRRLYHQQPRHYRTGSRIWCCNQIWFTHRTHAERLTWDGVRPFLLCIVERYVRHYSSNHNGSAELTGNICQY